MAQEKSTQVALAGDGLIGSEGEPAVAPRPSPFAILGNVDILRQVTLILGLAICLAIAVFIMLWGKEPDMRPLGQFTTEELVKTLDFLDLKQLRYKVEGNTVLVTADDYSSIALQLKREGLAKPDLPTGDALLLKDTGFGVSQRLEGERLKYSREQQLARAIEQYRNVSKATVLLAIPKDNVFARNERKPSATVVVNLAGNTMLRQEEVDAIVDTVASAVHDLEPARVTVTDQNGRLLNSGSQDAASARSRKEFEMQEKKELEYKQKIDAILKDTAAEFAIKDRDHSLSGGAFSYDTQAVRQATTTLFRKSDGMYRTPLADLVDHQVRSSKALLNYVRQAMMQY